MNNKERNYLRVYYDEKKGIIKCKGETITFDEKGLKSTSRIEHEGINNVNDALIKFLAYNGSDFKQLVEDKVIRIDSNLLDPNYTSAIGYEFDLEKGCVVPKRIRRSAFRELNGGYDNNEVELRGIPEVKTETAGSESKAGNSDTKINPLDKEEVIKSIISLNPDVEFNVVRNSGGVDYIEASVAGDKIELPEGFYYNKKNGITNKHVTDSGEYITIDVRPLAKKETEVINKRERKDDEETPIVGNFKVGNWKKLKTIVRTGLVLAGGAIILLALSKTGKDDIDTNKGKTVPPKPDKEIYQQDYTYVQPPKDETIYVQNTPVPTPEPTQVPTPVPTEVPTEAPVEEVVHNEENNDVYETTYNDEYSNIRAEGMEDQLNDIVGIAYRNIGDIYSFINGGSLTETMMPCNLELLAPSEDRDAVAAIMAERNYVVNNAYTDQNVPLTTSDVYGFLSDYVNYVYEGGTLFGGNAIKAYDYLDQYSQYIVNVIGQSMLQLYQGFEYASPYVEYSYGDLVEKITATHGELCDSLLNGRSY